MDMAHLAFRSPLQAYQQQAEQLLEQWNAGDRDAIRLFRERHPQFLDEKIPWLPKKMTDAEVRGITLNLPDAQLAIARWYSFADWAALAQLVDATSHEDSPIFRFESAVEALITGDAAALERCLRADPELVRARSTRITPHDPPRHRATLLHYIAANGVEGYRQKTPRNAVEIARMLLEASADPDALADMYGGQCTTLSLLVSSCHPAKAGLQVPLVHLLLDYGAAVDEHGNGSWTSPLMTALAFGYRDAAEALTRRGARTDTLAAAAGLGRLEDARRLLATADSQDRHRALALAAQHGHVELVRLLLGAGEDPNRYNPEGNHAHSTPLHQAVCAAQFDVVRLLVERGASLEIRDTLWDATPLGWAEHCEQPAIAEYLRGKGAKR
jgi:ankyrin repeat protein